jgi:hypothetical protein
MNAMISNATFSSHDTFREEAAVAAFNSELNQFEAIDFTQAWSLLWTAGRSKTALGNDPEIGRFFNYAMVATMATGILWALTLNAPVAPL